MPTCSFHFHKQFSVVVSASLIGQSSLSFITSLHMLEHVLFLLSKTRCGLFYYPKHFSVDVSDSLIGHSSLSFNTGLHMLEHVLFYYQRQAVVKSLSLRLKRK